MTDRNQQQALRKGRLKRLKKGRLKEGRKASRKASRKAKPKPEKPDAEIIVGIERGNRMMVRWPASLQSLTWKLTYDPESVNDTMLGPVEELKGGVNKKLTPLNYVNAHAVINLIAAFEKMGTRTYISPEFRSWFLQEKKAAKLAKEAASLLTYEDETKVWERFADKGGKPVVEENGQHKVKLPFLDTPLYPWQAVAMQFLDRVTRDGRGAFICDETGLGKTFEVMAHLKSQNHKAVIICPAGVVDSWYQSVKLATDYKVVVLGRDQVWDIHEYDVIIGSYSRLKKHAIFPLMPLMDHEHRVLVLDESHYAKNYDAKRTQEALLLAGQARHTLVVTATPLMNRVMELHPLLRATRRLWTEMSHTDFARHYSEDPSEIAEKLSGFMVRRRMKNVWHNAPQGHLREAWVPLSNAEDYYEAEKNFIKWLERTGASQESLASAERGKALVKLNKLRQLSAEGKVEEAKRIISQTLERREQVIVFCGFNGPLKALATHFREATGKTHKGQTWKGSAMIIGATPQSVRTKIIDNFMKGKLGLLCVGSGAGGVGINLQASAFSYFLDLPWNPALLEQNMGRTLRLGQDRDVYWIKTLAKGTIDHRMEAMIQDKAAIFRDAVGDEEAVDRVTSSQAVTKNSMLDAMIRSYLSDPTGSKIPQTTREEETWESIGLVDPFADEDG